MSLPWKTVRDQVRTVNGDHIVAIIWETGQHNSPEIMKHDCAFIVEACNNHAELLQHAERAEAEVARIKAERDALAKDAVRTRTLLLRWLRLTNVARGDQGATVADWDKLRQESHDAIDAAREKP